ncbi:uncharacterized protein SEPMUDRAFT_53287 [Sphaerulina musiva SO2202]|uniref:histidine kinase n=1 Tax=Sphaerulina musiva (strain SO2202) TaxID=692275 RepID=M3BRU4_SPHMS|nr:uncharacterized protein SEPMUDRAFT_53287 [Sphaerulina musiva SO2202]EMF08833.1 hypothetical protein SEPMUDRAFT_53287 [Sphaerulina musiva SO2202]
MPDSVSGQQQQQESRFRLRTEHARQRDVWRYLYPWSREYHRALLLNPHIFPTDKDQPITTTPRPCPDIALAAFAQLVALRLHARRCLITLCTGEIDYVLTEATKTMSLQYESVEDARDAPWLGTCSYLSDDGLNSLAMDSWRRARHVRHAPAEQDYFYTESSSAHWQIISDVRGTGHLAQRGFVRRSSGLRFYAAIPLRSGSGSVLGSLAILDDMPRHGISAVEMSYLEEVADTITQHLNATVVHSQRQRSERMVQSLGLFNNGKSSLRRWWLKQEATRVSAAGRHKSGKMTRGEQTTAANEEFGFKTGSTSDRETTSARTYARASNLMREAIGADGVVFLEVSSHSTGTKGPSLDTSSASDRFVHRLTSDGEASDTTAGTMCRLHAFSSIEDSSINNAMRLASGFNMPERLLLQLIRQYPNGHIFNYDANGADCTSSGGDESANSSAGSKRKRSVRGHTLPEIMPNAKSIAFYPIWNEDQDRFTSATFLWSTSPYRYFDPIEDITYLASWGHSLLAELGRLETIASDKAKGSFISSVSHELRSPLHGILAGVEFLMESDLSAFQQEMARTISMAGRTLLDTVNHILDYAKMSSFTRAERKSRISADEERQLAGASPADKMPDEIGVSTEFDLANLIEEVVETIVSAHRFGERSRNAGSKKVSVTLNISWRKSWKIRGSPGAWTRIVQNLVSNALKYTTKGVVAIRLDLLDRPIRFSVQDSGIGISKKFLETGLYTPFKQESSLSSGTGLGLSIVQQICKDMNATIALDSTLGKGTTATVGMNAAFVANVEDPDVGSGLSFRMELNVSKYHWIVPTPDEDTDLGALGVSVMETAKSWLQCDTSHGPSFSNEGTGPCVVAIAEDLLLLWAQEGPQALRKRMAAFGKMPPHVLVLGDSLQSVFLRVPAEDLPFSAVLIHQPVGPQKLLRAITSDRDSTQLGSHLEKGPWDFPVPYSSMTPQLHLIDAPSPAAAEVSAGSAGPDGTKPQDPGSLTPTTSFASYEEQPTRSPSIRQKGFGNTVLLVEDNQINMRVLVMLMKRQGVPYLCANNGREAVDLFRANPESFFLVLMDINMPVMDGFQATAKIRETERKRRLPRSFVAALTGVTNEEAKTQAFASGVDEFLSKPVLLKEMKEMITKARQREMGRATTPFEISTTAAMGKTVPHTP